MNRRLWATGSSVVLLLAVGCASDPTSAPEPPVDAAPAAGRWDESNTATSAVAYVYDFRSLSEMTATSDAVLHGTITAEHFTTEVDRDPRRFLDLEVEAALIGDGSTENVSFGDGSTLTSDDRLLIPQGLATINFGDEVVVFLIAEPETYGAPYSLIGIGSAALFDDESVSFGGEAMFSDAPSSRTELLAYLADARSKVASGEWKPAQNSAEEAQALRREGLAPNCADCIRT